MANKVAIAQNQNLTATKYIQDRPEDLLLIELNQLQEKNLTAQRVVELRQVKGDFTEHYFSLARTHYGLDKDQVKNLNQDKQITLANLLFKKAKFMATFQLAMIPILICIPIVGWAVLNIEFGSSKEAHSFLYCKHFNKLKSMCGEENWFPHELLK